MIDLTTNPGNFFPTKTYSLASLPHSILIKKESTLIMRSGLVVAATPLKIYSLFSLVDLFQSPFKISYVITFIKNKTGDFFSCVFFLDLDVSNCISNFKDDIKSSIPLFKHKFKLLQKNIAIKDIQVSVLTYSELFKVMNGVDCKKIKRFAYQLSLTKDIDIFKKVVFSNNKIKQIDYRRDSVIPTPIIPLGTSLSNKPIGVVSHILFLTGRPEFRRQIVYLLLSHLTQNDDHHVIIFDFGLNISIEKSFFRQFLFDDFLLDPLSFKESFSPSQKNTLVSHFAFISKNILRLNDRQVILLEDKLSTYFDQSPPYSLSSFLSFISEEVAESLVTSSSPQSGSFSDLANNSNTDYTALIKNAQTGPNKSYDFDMLIAKISHLTHILSEKSNKREPFSTILAKNHLDVFSITTTPDLKALFFYLFNLYYTLNDQNFNQFKFFFLNIDSLLFEHFNDFDISFLHPDIMHSLFDSGDIFSVKKIFNQLDTRIYTSAISNAPYSLLSQSAKENLDKLQYLHGYSLIESPALQRQEFFKITSPIDQTPQIHLPDYDLFIFLVKLLYAADIEFSFVQLFAQFNISSSLCKQLTKQHYLSKKGRLYMLTDISLQLKKYINNYLAFQPNLTLEENDFLIKISNPETYNVFKLKDYSFSENIERTCTRLLAQSLFTQSFYSFTSFLLYYFIQFKQHIITDKQLSQLLVIALQINTESSPAQSIPIIPSTNPTEQESTMQDYYNEMKDVIQETDQNQTVITNNPSITDSSIQSKIDKISHPVMNRNNNSTILPNLDSFPAVKAKLTIINDRIHKELTDKTIIFPQRPFFFIAKFLKPDTIDLLYQDLSELNNLTGDMNKLEVS